MLTHRIQLGDIRGSVRYDAPHPLGSQLLLLSVSSRSLMSKRSASQTTVGHISQHKMSQSKTIKIFSSILLPPHTSVNKTQNWNNYTSHKALSNEVTIHNPELVAADARR